VTAPGITDLGGAARARGATVFLTTHDMAAAEELCDRVAFIVDGRVAGIDSPLALKLKYGQRNVRVEYLLDGHTVHADHPLDGLADDAAFHHVLRERDVQTIHTREATLAEVFIQVTGRPLA
jgi:fluoroquinolone transport system ATP-binding protein